MNITDDFDVNCTQCLDTGEYFNGKEMLICSCEAGKKIKEDGDDSQRGVPKEKSKNS